MLNLKALLSYFELLLDFFLPIEKKLMRQSSSSRLNILITPRKSSNECDVLQDFFLHCSLIFQVEFNYVFIMQKRLDGPNLNVCFGQCMLSAHKLQG